MTTDEKITSIRVSMRWRDIEQHEADFLLAELDAARAREAKLREALEQALTFHQVTHIHAVLRAALAEGEDTRD